MQTDQFYLLSKVDFNKLPEELAMTEARKAVV